MKPPDEVKRELVVRWLDKAEEDFRVAGYLSSGETVFLSAIGFHAQQAVEKYLKALLVHHQVEFPKTHDIQELLNLLAPVAPSLAGSLRDAAELTPYGVEVRYPDDFPDMTQDEAVAAVDTAAKVREAVLAALKDVSWSPKGV